MDDFKDALFEDAFGAGLDDGRALNLASFVHEKPDGDSARDLLAPCGERIFRLHPVQDFRDLIHLADFEVSRSARPGSRRGGTGGRSARTRSRGRIGRAGRRCLLLAGTEIAGFLRKCGSRWPGRRPRRCRGFRLLSRLRPGWDLGRRDGGNPGKRFHGLGGRRGFMRRRRGDLVQRLRRCPRAVPGRRLHESRLHRPYGDVFPSACRLGGGSAAEFLHGTAPGGVLRRAPGTGRTDELYGQVGKTPWNGGIQNGQGDGKPKEDPVQ